MGGVQEFLVGPLKGPLALVEEDQPIRHQFRQAQVMGDHDGGDLQDLLEAVDQASRSHRR